ncbi:MAG: hypothetical protein WB493_09440, partial [Anaeromyxobacteraceae bacterium]
LLPARAGAQAAPPAAQAAQAGAATVTLAARSIGSRRGNPPEKRAHAALLIRIEGQPGGFIVQGGKEAVPGWLPGRARVVGYVIPSADPSKDFTRATGAFWGEPDARELPTREIAAFVEPGLTEARIRALVDSLNEEFRPRDYVLSPGPSSNSLVSRFLERLGRPLPPLGGEDLPGWGWKP